MTAGIMTYAVLELVAIGGWSHLNFRVTPLALTFPPIALACLELNRRGFSRAAAWLFVGGYIVMTCLRAPYSGGIHAPSLDMFPVMTIFAGMILGRRAGLIVALTCSAIGLVLLGLEFAGAGPDIPARSSPIVHWAALTLFTIISLFLLRIALDRTENALQAARAELASRLAAEQALKESEARYRLLADNSSDVILLLDLVGVVDYVSPSVRGIGHEPSSLIGREGVALLHPDDRLRAAKRHRALLAGEANGAIEVRIRRQDDSWTWMESSPAALRDETGQIIGVIASLRDISQRKAAEAAVQEIGGELARVARTSTLGAFAASIAHETNQPLAAAAIDGETAERWLGAPEPNLDRARRALRRATGNVRRASDVIGRLRSMVVKEQSSRSRFDLAEAIREVLALAKRQCAQNEVTVRLDLKPTTITADRIQIQQVVLNLVSNAIDAVLDLPEGRRAIVVRAGADKDGQATFSVEDRGHGVPDEQLGRIFDTLFTTKTGGTGLGLAISKSIVEAHGGRIWAEPAEPEGTVFKAILPMT